MRMRYINNEISDCLSFCVNPFWCRWDKALFNWVVLYIVSMAFVYMGRETNILFGNNSISSLLITALIVVIEIISVSFLHKMKNDRSKILHENKSREFDV